MNNLTFGFTAQPSQPANPVQGNLTISDNANDTNVMGYVQLRQGLTILNVPASNVTNTVKNTLTNVQVMNADLDISNGGNTTTNISNSQLYEGLTVTGPTSGVATSNLTLTNCTVIDTVVVDNSSGGNTSTIVSGGWLEEALYIINGQGVNSITIGNGVATQIGPNPATSDPVVTIVNGSGGSFTQFNGAVVTGPPVTVTAPVTVTGGISIANGATLAATNIVNFVGVTACGRVEVTNGGTVSSPSQLNSVNIQYSKLGTQVLSASNPNPVIVSNGTGYDTFAMTGATSAPCTAPWGVAVNNDVEDLGPGTVWGSNTTITGSSIGTGAFGPNNGTAGQGFGIQGDNGSDIVTVSSSTIGGTAAFDLYGGNNSVSFQQTSMAALAVTTGSTLPGGASLGNDSVSITNACTIAALLSLQLNGVTNAVTINAGDTLPDPNQGSYLISSKNTPISLNTLTIDTTLFQKIPLGAIVGFTVILK